MRLLSTPAALALILLAFSGVLLTLLASETPHGDFSGTLLAAESGNPLRDTYITFTRVDHAADSFSAYTDAQGRFTFRHVPAGAYRLYHQANAHLQLDAPLYVKENRTTDMVLELQPQAPFLRLFSTQKVFTTQEEPSLRCQGFVPDNELTARLYRVETANASVWHGWLPASLTLANRDNFAAANLDEIPELKYQETKVFPIDDRKRDLEGVFRQELKFGRLAPGIYLAAISAEEQRGLEVFTVTDLGLVVKASTRQLLAYAVDIASGKPVPETEVQVLREQKPLASGKTDADGLLSLALPNALEYGDLQVVGRSGASVAVASLYVYEHNSEGALKAYTYTDRPIYRPGQKVYFKTMLRRLDGTRYKVPSAKSVSVRVVDRMENVIYSGQQQTNSYGSLNGELTLSEDALPGWYQMTLTTDEGEFDSGFSVAEYRKPEFEVTVKTPRKRYTRNETVTATVEARYFYGAPVPKADVYYYVYRAPYWYYPEADEWDADLSTTEGDDGEYYYDGEMISYGEAKTDENGRFTLTVKPPKDAGDEEADHDWRYSIQAHVSDPARRYEEGTGGVMVTQGDFRLEGQPEDWVAKPGQSVEVKIRALDYDGKPVAGVRGKAQIGRAIWRKNKEQFSRESSASWQTDELGVATITITPKNAGDYRVRLETGDRRGHRITAQAYLWVMREEYADFDYPYQDLDVKADKTLYHQGETAEIMVNTRYAPRTALLTIEGANILQQRPVQLAGKTSIIKVPVTSELMPAARVTISFVKGKHFLSGDAVVNVSRQTKALRVQVTPDKKTYLPGDRATCQVTATTPDGKPATAEVSLGIVDEAIYAIADDSAENIASFFYPKQLDGVNTVFSFPEIYLSGDNKAGSTIRTRRTFRDTAFWAPSAVTDANGKASFTFTLPDNLTTWRATCRAADLETRVGQATAKAVVNKPFLIRLETPRFFTQHDELRLTAVAHNLTNETLDAEIGLTSNKAFTLKHNNPTTRVRIAPGQTARVEWNADITGLGSFPARVWAKAGRYTDAMELTLPILPPGRERLSRVAGVAATEAKEYFTVRKDAIPGTQQLIVRLAPSLASAMLSSLNYLAQYPYGCTEQTMSSFLPDVVISQMLDKLKMPNPDLKKRLPAMVQAGLLRLYGYQHPDGGWRWWEYDETDPWMTAYVVYGLVLARDAGFTVNTSVLRSGTRALDRMVSQNWSIDPDTKAYMAYVLAQAGKPATAKKLTDALLGNPHQNQLSNMSDWGKAMLALALHLQGRDDEGRTLLNGVWSHFSNNDYRPAVSGVWRADTEQAAALLLATVTLMPNDPRSPHLVQWLIGRRQDDHWYSTRDTAFALYALSEYLYVTHELQPNMQAVVMVNGKQVAEKSYTQQADIFAPESEVTVKAKDLPKGRTEVQITKTGQGQIYYTAQLREVDRLDPSKPVVSNSGLVIERHYRKLGRAGLQPSEAAPTTRSETTFRSGDLIEVTLTVRSRRSLDYLMVEDPLPAGCEAQDRGTVDSWEWNSWWCEQITRDEQVGFALRHLDPGVRRITYCIYAQNPGRFTALPPRIFDMYNPDVRGEGIAQLITIRP